MERTEFSMQFNFNQIFCSQESKLRRWCTLGVTGKLDRDLVPDGFQGMDYVGGKSPVLLSKGIRVVVRVVASTDWSALG